MRLFFLVAAVLFAAVGAFAQTTASPAAGPSPATSQAVGQSPVRLLFDSRGGFKIFKLNQSDGTFHPLLNPGADAPVSFDIFRNGVQLPLKYSESKAAAQAGDPGFMGPTFSAEGLQINLWGVDLSSISDTWTGISYEIANTGASASTTTFRFVFDTYLGESNQDHFVLIQGADGSARNIATETRAAVSDTFQLIGSTRDNGNDALFFVIPGKKDGLASPQRSIAANIRRLQNGGASFDTEEGRAFNLLPFSINDSGLGFYYDSVVLLPGQRISIDFILSASSKNDADSVKKAMQKMLASHRTSPSQQSSAPVNSALGSLDADLLRLNALISRLNDMMNKGNYRQGDLEQLLLDISNEQAKLKSRQ